MSSKTIKGIVLGTYGTELNRDGVVRYITEESLKDILERGQFHGELLKDVESRVFGTESMSFNTEVFRNIDLKNSSVIYDNLREERVDGKVTIIADATFKDPDKLFGTIHTDELEFSMRAYGRKYVPESVCTLLNVRDGIPEDDLSACAIYAIEQKATLMEVSDIITWDIMPNV